MNVLDLPRYQNNPFHLFFETYVLDVIGALPEGKELDNEDVERVFGAESSSWREAVCTALRLSQTIDIAILDSWGRSCDQYGEFEPRFAPFAFAQDFVDRYFEADSRVDVWEGDELAQAQARVTARAERQSA